MKNDLYGRKPQSHGRVPQKPLTDIIDSDTALILSLIFLLRQDSRNPNVILALLYILT